MDDREVDAWWDSLSAERRRSIYRWLVHHERPAPVHEDQVDLLAEVGEVTV